MKGEIKLVSELKANEFLFYMSDKIWLKGFDFWLKILKNWIIKIESYKERVQTSSSFATKLQAFVWSCKIGVVK